MMTLSSSPAAEVQQRHRLPAERHPHHGNRQRHQRRSGTGEEVSGVRLDRPVSHQRPHLQSHGPDHQRRAAGGGDLLRTSVGG